MRIGHGYDAHRLGEGRNLIIGGVTIPYHLGLLAHSDGDVLLHAIMDSLLGAAGVGDIGAQFPDSDEKYKGISSILLLKECAFILSREGLKIEYIDSTIIAQAPKMARFIPQMKLEIASALGIDPSKVNVKATTEERMGFTGSGEGIAAHSVCILV